VIAWSLTHDLASDTWRAEVEVDHPVMASPYAKVLTGTEVEVKDQLRRAGLDER
jgi:DNA-directed RNA polymerase subunit L